MMFSDEPVKCLMNVFMKGYPVETTKTTHYCITHYFSNSFWICL